MFKYKIELTMEYEDGTEEQFEKEGITVENLQKDFQSLAKDFKDILPNRSN